MNYELLRFPSSRVATFDVGHIGRSKHHIAGFLEVDVTRAKERIAALTAAGHEVSFTAWALRIIGRAVAENPAVHAVNYGRGTQLAFHDVDIAVPIERVVDSTPVPLVTVLREVNQKSVTALHAELQALKRQPVESAGDYVLGANAERGAGARMAAAIQQAFFRMPQPVRLLLWRLLLRNPHSIREHLGTVVVTNVGMVRGFSGWALPKGMHNLCLALGSINRKPWVHEGAVAIREILHLTVQFDHDVIDGAPAARFLRQLVHALEEARDL